MHDEIRRAVTRMVLAPFQSGGRLGRDVAGDGPRPTWNPVGWGEGAVVLKVETEQGPRFFEVKVIELRPGKEGE